MRLLLLALVTATFLGGCIYEDQPLEAHATLATANGHAEERLPDGLFVGMAGVEGDLDIERLEAELRDEADEELNGMADAFDFRVPQGTVGDGLPGSWFSLHVRPSEWFFDAALVTQVGTDGVLGSYLWEEEAYEAEGDAEVGFDLLRLMTPYVQESSSRAEETPLTTHTDDWHIRSGQAAAIARGVPAFADHVANETAAEWIYIYIPTFEGSEIDEGEPFGNLWVVAHTDLDLLMDGEEPSAVIVIIDAATGEVEEVEIEVPMRSIEVLSETFTLQGGLVPSTVLGDDPTKDVTFTVTDEMAWLTVEAEGDVAFELRDPDGMTVEVSESGHLFEWFEAPLPGTWTLTASAATLTPNQEIPFDVHVTADVPA